MEKGYKKTIYASFVGYVVQAIINNFAPLLFLTFNDIYDISLSKISLLITINFCVQLTVDLISAKFINVIGYRAGMILAHLCAAVGIAGLAVFPEIMPNPYTGLIISIVIYAIGGGILEVLVSPIVESCPTENKEGYMSLLHSFYCWGCVAVVILSTVFFGVFGIANWRILALLWAVVPVINGIAFTRVPIATLEEATAEESLTIPQLLKNGLFWIMFLMMICAGASELGISQWASTFAEKALGVPKAVGDLAGPLSFAVLMGASRTFYAKFSEKIKLEKFMMFSAILCVVSYLMASLSPNPVLSFVGCALSGLSVGIMWPGTFSLASASIKGGTAMFAFFAFAGDIGCSAGPTLVGVVTEACGGNMNTGILTAVIFPAILVAALIANDIYKKKKKA